MGLLELCRYSLGLVDCINSGQGKGGTELGMLV